MLLQSGWMSQCIKQAFGIVIIKSYPLLQGSPPLVTETNGPNEFTYKGHRQQHSSYAHMFTMVVVEDDEVCKISTGWIHPSSLYLSPLKQADALRCTKWVDDM